MAGSGPNQGDIFEIKRIRRLVELMNEHDLAEVDLRQGDLRIRLRKGGEPVITTAPARPAAAPPAVEAPPASATEGLPTINSPMVGTFYGSPSPEAPPFVKVGDHVGPRPRSASSRP